jgi:hypothetical protein
MVLDHPCLLRGGCAGGDYLLGGEVMNTFEATAKAVNFVMDAVFNPEERTCLNCGDSECRRFQISAQTEIKTASCDLWKHDFQGMSREVKGAMKP